MNKHTTNLEPAMTVAQRLKGCPTGATHDALLLHHTQAEIAAALVKGAIKMEIRDYAKPRNFKVRWFYLNGDHK
jgi:hypothetical protein